jgi:hypothetical protein
VLSLEVLRTGQLPQHVTETYLRLRSLEHVSPHTRMRAWPPHQTQPPQLRLSARLHARRTSSAASSDGSPSTTADSMLPQAPLRAVSPPTTLSKAYLPSDYTPSALAASMLEPTSSHHDAVRISATSSLGSTAKGIMIGIFSVLGAAGICLIIAAVIYYFRYTQQGRIFLDRISRPGEYDDEQQFAKEEAEALEDMDDIQRVEYMRAKGRTVLQVSRRHGYDANTEQPSYKQTRPNPLRRTYRFRSSWLYKRRGSLRGNLSPSWRLPTVSSKAGPRSSSSTPSAAFRATCPSRNRTKSTTGRPRCTTSQRTRALRLASQQSPTRYSDYLVCTPGYKHIAS